MGTEPSVELLISLALLEEKRDRHGVDWCSKKSVGALRRRLARALPVNVALMAAARSPEINGYVETQRRTQSVLAAMCAACGGCEWAKK